MAAIDVGHPFLRFASVIQVQHRSDLGGMESVGVEGVQPEERVAEQEAADLAPAEIKGVTVTVGFNAPIGLFVQPSAVEVSESLFIGGKVGGGPIENDADIP